MSDDVTFLGLAFTIFTVAVIIIVAVAAFNTQIKINRDQVVCTKKDGVYKVGLCFKKEALH